MVELKVIANLNRTSPGVYEKHKLEELATTEAIEPNRRWQPQAGEVRELTTRLFKLRQIRTSDFE